jgi:hypothetical protein
MGSAVMLQLPARTALKASAVTRCTLHGILVISVYQAMPLGMILQCLHWVAQIHIAGC